MDAFVARQPIFDRGLRVHGYELLCSSGDRSPVGGPPAGSRVFATTLHRVGLERLTGGRLAFVDFSRELLVEGYALLLPPERIVVGIDAPPVQDPDLMAACQRLKAAGYRLSLRAPAGDRGPAPLHDLADILTMDVAASPRRERPGPARRAGTGPALLARGVDTGAEFEQARARGFHLFQGPFFQKPARPGAPGIGCEASRTLELLQLLCERELDLVRVERLVRADLSLCYRLLRYLNSAAFGWRAHIESVGHALVLLGDDGVRRWLWLSALGELSAEGPDELVTASSVRAWLCESLGAAARVDAAALHLFLTGMLSLLDGILGRSMHDLLGEVDVPGPVRLALLDRTGPTGEVLRAVEAAERADWPGLRSGLEALGLTELAAASRYREALSAADALAGA